MRKERIRKLVRKANRKRSKLQHKAWKIEKQIKVLDIMIDAYCEAERHV